MIYTVTLNPSLDYIVSVENFRLGYTNRTVSELMFPGGKGINVSIVLRNLNFESTALGFAAGFTGDEIVRRLEELGIRTDFVRLAAGTSRINFKLRSIEGTEVNGRGPEPEMRHVEMLMAQLEQMKDGDILFLSGSIPSSLPDSIYRDMMERVKDRKIQVAVDAGNELLRNTLEYRPMLFKPNHHELGEMFGREFSTGEEIISYGRKLREMGARNVLVSMAGDGAVLLAEDGSAYIAPAPEGKLKNSVGSGDAMVAGFMAGWTQRRDYRHAFHMGIAAGSASAFSEHFATGEEIRKVYERVTSRRAEC